MDKTTTYDYLLMLGNLRNFYCVYPLTSIGIKRFSGKVLDFPFVSQCLIELWLFIHIEWYSFILDSHLRTTKMFTLNYFSYCWASWNIVSSMGIRIYLTEITVQIKAWYVLSVELICLFLNVDWVWKGVHRDSWDKLGSCLIEK